MRFLVETHVVSYVTQLELVDLLTPSMPETNVPLLAVGNPDGSLPAAGREVRDLARLRSGATALEGAQATKDGSSAWLRSFPTSTSQRTGCSTPSGPSAPTCCWPAPTRPASA